MIGITNQEILGLSDPNIIVDDTTKVRTIVKSNGITKNYWRFILTYKLRCKNCGYFMNKNGFKTVQHKGHISVWGLNFIIIKKQKFICKYCKHTDLAKLNDTNPNDHILRNVKVNAALELRNNVTIKHTAELFGISSNTVLRQAEGLAKYYKISYKYLPRHIAFDDFKSGKMSSSGMSIGLMNSETHQPLDIIQSRTRRILEDYFLRYSYLARAGVETITVDLFSPYRGIIQRVFPNAKIIADRFHVVNQVSTALNRERIKVMNHYGSNTSEYRQLKSLHKLLFKKSDELNFKTYKKRRNFNYSYLTDTEVVERLISLSPSLRDAYEFYQDVTHIVTKSYNSNELDKLLNPQKEDIQYLNLPDQMKKAKKTLIKHQVEIENSFVYSFSNGPLEGINNKIKVINRTAYGHRSFKNFRLRILISFSNTYFSKNYTQKATESVKDSIA